MDSDMPSHQKTILIINLWIVSKSTLPLVVSIDPPPVVKCHTCTFDQTYVTSLLFGDVWCFSASDIWHNRSILLFSNYLKICLLHFAEIFCVLVFPIFDWWYKFKQFL